MYWYNCKLTIKSKLMRLFPTFSQGQKLISNSFFLCSCVSWKTKSCLDPFCFSLTICRKWVTSDWKQLISSVFFSCCTNYYKSSSKQQVKGNIMKSSKYCTVKMWGKSVLMERSWTLQWFIVMQLSQVTVQLWKIKHTSAMQCAVFRSKSDPLSKHASHKGHRILEGELSLGSQLCRDLGPVTSPLRHAATQKHRSWNQKHDEICDCG